MAGFQSLLARVAVGELLSSLSQDDWFFVLRVSNTPTLCDALFTSVYPRWMVMALMHLDASIKVSEHLQRTFLYVFAVSLSLLSPCTVYTIVLCSYRQ